MLCVPTFVADSGIHGRGLYAAEPVRRGTIIWRFDPSVDRVLTSEERDALDGPGRSYCYEQTTGVWVLCGDDAIYMNHADDPNCDDPDPHVTVARRDIAVGEELTVDYRCFDISAATWLPGSVAVPDADHALASP